VTVMLRRHGLTLVNQQKRCQGNQEPKSGAPLGDLFMPV